MQGVSAINHPSSSARTKPSAGLGWMVSPLVDTMFVCGGLLWILVLLQRWLVPANSGDGQFLFVALAALGTHAFSDTHFASTLIKLFADRKRLPMQLISVLLPIILAMAVLAVSLLVPTALGWSLRCYFVLVVHHYCRQSFGICLIYCRLAKYHIGPQTKNALRWLFDAVAVASILRSASEPGWFPETMLGVQIPQLLIPAPVLVAVAALVLSVATVYFCVILIYGARKTNMSFPIPAMLMVLTSAVLFLSGANLNRELWLFAPAFFHGTQYLILMVVSGPAINGANQLGQTYSIGSYAVCLLIGATVFFWAMPFSLSLMGFPLEMATLAVFVALSIHHFITDAVIWKRPSRS